MFHTITLAEAVPNEGETRNAIHPLVLFCRVLEMTTKWQERQQTSQMGIIIVSTHCKTLQLRFIGRMNTDSVLPGRTGNPRILISLCLLKTLQVVTVPSRKCYISLRLWNKSLVNNVK